MEVHSAAEKSFRHQFFLLAVAVAIVNTGFGIIFPIFPKLLVEVGGGDASDLGKLAAAFGGAYIIGSPLFGNIADKRGKKKVILVGLIGFSLSNFIYIFATDITDLYIARIIEGFFAAAILPPAIALTAQLSPKENRGRYLGLLGASQTTGIIIGPLLGGVLYEGINIRGFTVYNLEVPAIAINGSLALPFYASAIMGFMALAWSFLKLPEGKVTKKNKLSLYSSTLIKQQDPLKMRIGNTLRHQINVLPRPLFMFMLFVFAEMLSILAWLTIEPGFVFYFYDELLLSPTDFGIFVAAFAIVSVIGQSVLGNLSDKVGRKPVLIVGQVFSFVFYFTLLTADSLGSLMISVIFAGIGSGLRDPAMKAWLSDVTEEEHRGTVFGIESGLIMTSQIFGPIIGGYLYVHRGMEFLFFIAIGINIINIFILTTLRFNSIQDTKIFGLKEGSPAYVPGT